MSDEETLNQNKLFGTSEEIKKIKELRIKENFPKKLIDPRKWFKWDENTKQFN